MTGVQWLMDWLPYVILLTAVSTLLGIVRIARCPNCDGRHSLRPLWEGVPSTPCLRCGGRGRVTLLNRVRVPDPPPLRVRP